MSLSGWCGERGWPHCGACRVDGCSHACHALALVDGCPRCVQNTEQPKSAIEVENGWRCAYLCSDCGHAWTTDWAADSLAPQGNERDSRGAEWENGASTKDAPAGALTPVVPGLTPARRG